MVLKSSTQRIKKKKSMLYLSFCNCIIIGELYSFLPLKNKNYVQQIICIINQEIDVYFLIFI